MDDGILERNLDNHFEAIDLCVARGLRMPALILTYSAIDFLAWLARPAGKTSVDRQEFVGFAKKYIVDAGFSQCSAIDLYAARCAHVHSNSFESSLSASGAASVVLYAWGSADPEALLAVLLRAGRADVKVVKVEALISAVKQAARGLIDDIRLDPARWELVLERSAKFFDENPELDAHVNELAAMLDARQKP